MSKVIDLLLCFMGPMSHQTLIALCFVTAKAQQLCCSLHQPYQETLSFSHWNSRSQQIREICLLSHFYPKIQCR